MKYRQAIAYAKQISALPQVESAVWSTTNGAGPDDNFVRVEDHLGNVTYLEDVCETRSLIAIWKEQAKQAR